MARRYISTARRYLVGQGRHGTTERDDEPLGEARRGRAGGERRRTHGGLRRVVARRGQVWQVWSGAVRVARQARSGFAKTRHGRLGRAWLARRGKATPDKKWSGEAGTAGRGEVVTTGRGETR